LGIDYETLRNINPKIISCSLTGFGSTGPWARKPAFDIIIQASSSLISFNASTEPDGRPAPLKLTVADLSGGMAAAYAIAAALYAREQTGEGQRIDIGMQDVIVSQLGYWASYLLNFGVKIDPWSSNIYGVFKAKDKYFIMCAHREGFWQNLCKTLNHEEWLTDPRFDSLSKRIQNREELRAIIEEILSTKEAAEWLEILTKGDVPCAPLNTLEEMLSEPQIIHRNMMIDVDHPLGGQVKLIGNPIKLSGTPEEVFEPPPLLGQHTVELLSELLGYPQEKIEALRDEKVID
jgi:formyl-CoA transferase/CoA:oxalate CoA-transferase